MFTTCPVCGNQDSFALVGANLREEVVCVGCHSRSRDRLLAVAIAHATSRTVPIRQWPADPSLRVLETTGLSPVSRVLDRFGHANIWYSDRTPEQGLDPRREGNVEHLYLADEAFDWIVTSDVFEHVRDLQKGLGELRRVLTPDGLLFFQVPYEWYRPATRQRIQVGTTPDQDVALLPEHYHGCDSLVYREYGADTPATLQRAGFTVVAYEGHSSVYGIVHDAVFVCGKDQTPRAPDGFLPDAQEWFMLHTAGRNRARWFARTLPASLRARVGALKAGVRQ